MKNTENQTIAAILVVGTMVAVIASAFGQGALLPTAPPDPTFKTLDQLEPRTIVTNLPYTITIPGSYYMLENMTSTTVNANGIIIDIDNVTLDLGGFELVGSDDGFGGDGILVFGLQTNITIRNGTIRNWRDQGINAVNGSGMTFESLRILNNDTDGLLCDDANLLLNCIAMGNGNDGLDSDDGCVFRNCTATGNGDNGIEGDDGCTISDSAGYLNSGHGIEVGDGGTINRSTGRDNEVFGIEANNGSTLIACVADLNTSNGFNVTQGCMITDCSARNNGGHGIRAFSTDSIIRNCRADNNALAGFFTSTSDVRFDNNHSTDNTWGFRSTAAGSFFTRNSASGNSTNYDLSAAGAFGPIVNVTGVGNIVGTGNADHPWANFEF